MRSGGAPGLAEAVTAVLAARADPDRATAPPFAAVTELSAREASRHR